MARYAVHALPRGAYGRPGDPRYEPREDGGLRPIDTLRVVAMVDLLAHYPGPWRLADLARALGTSPLLGERTKAKHRRGDIRGVPYLVRQARAAGFDIRAESQGWWSTSGYEPRVDTGRRSLTTYRLGERPEDYPASAWEVDRELGPPPSSALPRRPVLVLLVCGNV